MQTTTALKLSASVIALSLTSACGATGGADASDYAGSYLLAGYPGNGHCGAGALIENQFTLVAAKAGGFTLMTTAGDVAMVATDGTLTGQTPSPSNITFCQRTTSLSFSFDLANVLTETDNYVCQRAKEPLCTDTFVTAFALTN